jgi:hypothetical protein
VHRELFYCEPGRRGEYGVPVMQTLATGAIVLGLTASAAWAGFLSFVLLRLIGLV